MRHVLQCVAVCCSVFPLTRLILRAGVLSLLCCSVLQCVAVCCSVLQSVAECCSEKRDASRGSYQFARQSYRDWYAIHVNIHTLQHTATHCNLWYTHCNSLQLNCTEIDMRSMWISQVAVCCSVLQCVAVCCSVSQCIAVCRSVLQCVAGKTIISKLIWESNKSRFLWLMHHNHIILSLYHIILSLYL